MICHKWGAPLSANEGVRRGPDQRVRLCDRADCRAAFMREVGQ